MTLYGIVGPDGFIQSVGSMPDDIMLRPEYLRISQADYDCILAGGRFQFTGHELVDVGPEPELAQRTHEALVRDTRHHRDTLLTSCDWTHVADNPLSDAQRLLWQAYRTALRGVPAQDGFPHTVEWPERPA